MQTLSIDIPEKILDVLSEPSRYKVLFGGRGSAKSWSAALVLLGLSMQSPLRILCARELQNSIKDSVHKLLSDQIKRLNLTGFTITQDTIRHENGSEFIFKGIKNNIHSMKSFEGIDICWVEEGQTVSEESWDFLIPTVRKENEDEFSEIWITFNPLREDDPTYTKFVLNTPPNTRIAKVNWYDNKFFPKVLKQEMQYLKQTDYKKYLNVWEGECQIIYDGDPVYGEDYFKEEVHVKEKSFLEKEILLGFDLGKGYPACVVAQEQDDQLVVLYEFLGRGIILKSFIDEVLDTITSEYPFSSKPRYWSTCDSVAKNGNPVVEKTQMDIFVEKGLHPIVKWQNVEPGIDSIKNRLKKMTNKFEPSLIIHPRCRNLMEGFIGGYQVDKLGKIKKDNKFDNSQDALRFIVTNRYGFKEKSTKKDDIKKQTQSYNKKNYSKYKLF